MATTTQADFERADQIGAILRADGINPSSFEVDGSTVIYHLDSLPQARAARDLVVERGYRRVTARNVCGSPSLIVRR